MTTTATTVKQNTHDDHKELHSLSYAERIKLFGEFEYRKIGTRGDIQILGDWVKENVTRVYIPQLAGVATDGGTFKGHVQWHKKGEEQLKRAFAEVEAAGLANKILTYAGSFVPRMVRGSLTSPSNHAWATAFDINAQWNWLGDEPAKKNQKGCLLELVPIFETHGFYWGGNFKRKDGMHFELARLLSYDATPADAKLVVDNNWREAIDAELREGIAFASGKEMSKLVDEEWEGEDEMLQVSQFMLTRGRISIWNARQKKIYAQIR